MAVKVRADKLLLELGLAPSRERAQALILAGKVLIGEQKIEKAGANVDPALPVRLLGEDQRYVSRGGIKLEHALAHWQINLQGGTCLDVGASTGGFTDCMLQRGAARVIAVDTGYGQIDARLRADARVKLLEKTNARYLTEEQLRKDAVFPIGFAAIDVSFISVTLVLPAVIRAASPDEMVILIKPQFEVGRENVGKGGIVRDAALHQAAVEKIKTSVGALHGEEIDVIESPILGAEGNREFLLHAAFSRDNRFSI